MRPERDASRPVGAVRSPAAGPRRGVWGHILYWAPVWAALVLLAQVGLAGLRPALAESRRLDRVEERIETRHEAVLAHRSRLEGMLRARHDPIFLERERRALLDPVGPLSPGRAGL